MIDISWRISFKSMSSISHWNRCRWKINDGRSIGQRLKTISFEDLDAFQIDNVRPHEHLDDLPVQEKCEKHLVNFHSKSFVID